MSYIFLSAGALRLTTMGAGAAVNTSTLAVKPGASAAGAGEELYTPDSTLIVPEALPDLDLDSSYSFSIAGTSALRTYLLDEGVPGPFVTVFQDHVGDTSSVLEYIFAGYVSGLVESYGEAGDQLEVALAGELTRTEASSAWWLSRSSRRAVDATDLAFRYLGQQVRKIWAG